MARLTLEIKLRFQISKAKWGRRVKPGPHLRDKHNTSDISISISTRKKEHVPFFLCLFLCLCRLCYAYRTSGNQALGILMAFVTTNLFKIFMVG